LLQAQQRTGLDARFAPLFRNLALPAEKLEQFKNLLLERQSVMQDVMAAAREQGLDPRANPEELRKIVARANAESDDSLRALLGAEGFAQYQDYQQTLPQRSVVNQLQQSLSYTDAPLTTAQADELVRILATTAPSGPSADLPPPPVDGFARGPGRGGQGGPGGSTALVTTEAVQLAGRVLSTPQLEALTQLQQSQQAAQQLDQMVRAGRGNAPRGGG
jgi:hypothetical protein